MDKITWIKNIYTAIKEISDETFQKRIWVEGRGPEVSSYEEAISCLYDDFKFDMFLKVDLNLPLDLVEKLKILNFKLTNYSGKNTDEEIVNDPSWNEIRNFAKEIVAYKW